MKAITLFLGLIASVFLLTSCATKPVSEETRYVVEKEKEHTEVIPVEVEQPKEHHHIDYKGESLNK